MTEYRLVSDPRADLDIEAAFLWYEKEQPGLGLEFLDELRAAYNRIVEGPFKYPHPGQASGASSSNGSRTSFISRWSTR